MPQKDTGRSPVVSFRIGWKNIEKLKEAGLIAEDYDTPDLNSVVKQTFFEALENSSAKAAINTDFLQDISTGIEDLRNTSYQLMMFRLADHCKRLDRTQYNKMHQLVQELEIILDNSGELIRNKEDLPDTVKKRINAITSSLRSFDDADLVGIIYDLMAAKCSDYCEYLDVFL